MAPDDLRIVALAPARADDYMRFFDDARTAAPERAPGWAACYCHLHHVPPPLDPAAFDAHGNRLAMEARVACGEMEGYLAMRGGRVVGWLNAQPRHRLRFCDARIGIAAPPPDVPAHEAAAIVCFALPPGERAIEDARALLDGALADLAARGVRVADAWPRRDDDEDPSRDAFRGRRAWFEAAGFSVVASADGRVAMRKRLDPDR